MSRLLAVTFVLDLLVTDDVNGEVQVMSCPRIHAPVHFHHLFFLHLVMPLTCSLAHLCSAPTMHTLSRIHIEPSIWFLFCVSRNYLSCLYMSTLTLTVLFYSTCFMRSRPLGEFTTNVQKQILPSTSRGCRYVCYSLASHPSKACMHACMHALLCNPKTPNCDRHNLIDMVCNFDNWVTWSMSCTLAAGGRQVATRRRKLDARRIRQSYLLP